MKLVLILLMVSIGPGFSLTGLLWGRTSSQSAPNSQEKFRMAKRLFYQGERLFNKGKYKKAGKVLKNCLESFPIYSYAGFYLSRIYYLKGDYPDALKYIETAKSNHEKFSSVSSSTYQEYLGKLREQKTEMEEEIRQMKEELSRRAITDSTSSSGSRYTRQLQGAIAQKEQNIDSIHNRLLTPIAQLAETPADFHYIHGNILFKLKRFRDSFNQYLLTVKQNPKHGNAYSNLANLNYMSKRYKQALDYLEKAERNGAKPNPQFKAALLEAMKKK
ncbi:MAG: tetratricopeptide repeat protein [bacterium]|nr:tetratricopeptide repeat protein [bacterium]